MSALRQRSAAGAGASADRTGSLSGSSALGGQQALEGAGRRGVGGGGAARPSWEGLLARMIQQPPPAVYGQSAHEIDFEIHGNEMQFVEIELDPGESAVAEAGAMMYMTDGIAMETVFGDGSHQSQQGGFFDKMLGAGKRLITGESLFTTVFTHNGSGKGRVAFASPYPGKIIPLDLAQYEGQLVCQKDAFLCAAKGVAIGIAFQKKIGVALFGGEGFIMQKLEGDGLTFIHAGGTIVEKDLHDKVHVQYPDAPLKS